MDNRNKKPFVVAVDFDGVLCKDEFPKTGEANIDMISMLNNFRRRYSKEYPMKFILWTSRDEPSLPAVRKFCAEYGLKMDTLNTNVSVYKNLYGNDTRKVYADVYIDDHSVGYDILTPDLIYKELVNKLLQHYNVDAPYLRWKTDLSNYVYKISKLY